MKSKKIVFIGLLLRTAFFEASSLADISFQPAPESLVSIEEYSYYSNRQHWPSINDKEGKLFQKLWAKIMEEKETSKTGIDNGVPLKYRDFFDSYVLESFIIAIKLDKALSNLTRKNLEIVKEKMTQVFISYRDLYLMGTKKEVDSAFKQLRLQTSKREEQNKIDGYEKEAYQAIANDLSKGTTSTEQVRGIQRKQFAEVQAILDLVKR